MSWLGPPGTEHIGFSHEHAAAFKRLPDGANALFEDATRPVEQRKLALAVWMLIVKIEPRISKPTCGYGEAGEVYFGWNGSRRALDVTIDNDGNVSWFCCDHDADISSDTPIRNESRCPELPPEADIGYLMFLELFRSAELPTNRHARVIDGPAVGMSGFIIGHRAEDGDVLFESSDGVILVKPDWVREGP